MAVIDNIKIRLDEFVKNGGNVNDLKPGDSLYEYIKSAKVLDVNGKKLTIDEKLSRVGHPRDALYNVRKTLIKEVDEYLASGGSFHRERKSLPFYSSLKTYVRMYKEVNDKDIAYDDAMKELGYKEYSNIYYRYASIMNLKQYKDQDGFVDSYRKDEVMKSYIHQAARQLNVPIAIIVGLIGDQELKKYSLDVEFFEETRNLLLRELEKAKMEATLRGATDIENITLHDLNKTNLKLYNRLIYMKRRMASGENDSLTYKDVMYMLDLDDKMVDFKKVPEKKFNVEDVMKQLSTIAEKQGRKLYRKDIPDAIYRDVVRQSLKFGCYTKDWFKMYDIDYVDGVNNDRFKRFTVSEYPYMKRMKLERDSYMKKYLRENPNACREEIFEEYFNTCLNIYEVYKNKIHEFGIDDEKEPEE